VSSLDRNYHIIKRHVMTEKASDDMAKRNAYTFRVPVNANKVEIRAAVEGLFGVKVQDVNTLTVQGKWKIRGRNIGRSPAWKKAMVTLKDGETIDVL